MKSIRCTRSISGKEGQFSEKLSRRCTTQVLMKGTSEESVLKHSHQVSCISSNYGSANMCKCQNLRLWKCVECVVTIFNVMAKAGIHFSSLARAFTVEVYGNSNVASTLHDATAYCIAS